MLAVATIGKEISKIDRALDDNDKAMDVMTRRELYGSKQALQWALGQVKDSPLTAALLGAQVVEL